MLKINKADYVGEYRIHLVYENGVEGEVDFSSQPKINMFEPWEDQEFFSRFVVNDELRTLQWENGVDISPEFLYSKVSGVPQQAAFSVMMAEKMKLSARGE